MSHGSTATQPEDAKGPVYAFAFAGHIGHMIAENVVGTS